MSNKGFCTEGVATRRLAQREATMQTAALKEVSRKKRWAKKRWFMRNIKLKCHLTRGGDKFPKTELLTCFEMGSKNRVLVQNYISSLDQGKESTLWAWKISNVPIFKKALKRHLEL